MISIVIHTRNEEKNIQACIDSAKLLSDDIVVIDMESSDKTCDIATKNNVQIISFHYSNYVEPARGFGIQQAKGPWVMILDADERITKALAEEIQIRIKNSDLKFKNQNLSTTDYALQTTHYYIPRKNIFGKKKLLKHGGWWPDKQIRLINKLYFQKWPKQIHSTPIVDGSLGELKSPIYHYFHENLESMVEKTIIFENIESNLLFQSKRKVNIFIFFRKFLGELYRRLIQNLGFLDGSIGVIESIYQAYSKTITYLFLYEKYHKKKSSSV